MTLHAHAAIWKEGQFKTATGAPNKHFRKIKRLLTAICCPKVAVMHCKGHNRDGSKVAEGNQLADCQARKAALPLITEAFDLDRSCGTGKTTIY